MRPEGYPGRPSRPPAGKRPSVTAPDAPAPPIPRVCGRNEGRCEARATSLPLIVALLLLAGIPHAGAQQSDLSEFPVPTANALLQGIVTGPDGNLWFAERSANAIARMTPGGVVTEFPLPHPGLRALLAGRRPRRRAVVHRDLGRPDRAHDRGRIAHGVLRADRRESAHRSRLRPRRRALVHRAHRQSDRPHHDRRGRDRVPAAQGEQRAVRHRRRARRRAVVHRADGQPDRPDHHGAASSRTSGRCSRRTGSPPASRPAPTAPCGSSNARGRASVGSRWTAR